MGTGITNVIGGPHDFLPPRSDRSEEFQKLCNYVRPDILEEGDDMNILKYVKFKKVSNYVRPDVREEGDDMNILKYVKFKKV